MENTYIIFDEGFEKQVEFIKTGLSIEKISYQAHENERGFHEWLTREFKDKDIQRILIPISLPSKEENTEGLLLGLHIRLNYELPVEKRCIPILFITNLSLDNIITTSVFDRDNDPQKLLFTEGVSISSTDIDEIREKIETTKQLDDYETFLRQLNIRRKANVGGHDIANAWGCYKLARVVGVSDMVFSKESIAKHLKQLYAKYLICVNESYSDSKMSYVDLQPINCSGKRILFVDDKADEGWGELMEHIFQKAKEKENGFFEYVDSAKYKENGIFNFNAFFSECYEKINTDWDLIIVDLRLNPEKEDSGNSLLDPTELSGYKLIDNILSHNRGTQIMVLTASNKVWNINAALRRGAAGYYIKESPEFNYSFEESAIHYRRFKKEVEMALDKSCFRKYVELLDALPVIEDDGVMSSLNSYIDLSLFDEDKALRVNALNLIVPIEQICKKQFFFFLDELKESTTKKSICKIKDGAKCLFVVKNEKGSDNRKNVIDAIFFDTPKSIKERKESDTYFGYDEPDHNADITIIIAALRYGFKIEEDLCRKVITLKYDRNTAIAHKVSNLKVSKEDLRTIYEKVLIPIIRKSF